jgi:hypothetical protein
MKKIIFLFSCFILLASCKPTQNVAVGSNIEELWSKPPDLSKVVYTGGDGTSVDNAIIISGAGNSRNGIAAEYEYVAKKLGAKSVDWKLGGQGKIAPNGENKTNDYQNKKYDVLNFQNILNNETLTFYFDISDFYGKW